MTSGSVTILLTLVMTGSLQLTQTTTLDPDYEICQRPMCIGSQIEKLWPAEDPTLYYRCAQVSPCEWEAQVLNCAQATYFDFNKQACVTPVDWIDVCPAASTIAPTQTAPSEPPICSIPSCTDDEVNTLWPVPDRSDCYYQCEPNSHIKCGWIVVQKLCPKGLFFDFDTQSCVNPEDWTDVCSLTSTTTEVTTESSTTSEDPDFPLCTIPSCIGSQIEKLWPSEEPIVFYRCVNVTGNEWAVQKLYCPRNNYFDFNKQGCIDPADWFDVCSVTSTTTAPTQTTTEDPGFQICQIPKCSEKTAEKLWPDEDPTLYYRCIESSPAVWEPQELYCPRNNYFDFRKQVCVAIEEWTDVCERL